MAYRRIDDNDTIQIRRAQGGNKPETRTAAELNEYFSKEEPTIGTTGAAGALRYSDAALYISVNESTIAESNWEAITFNN